MADRLRAIRSGSPEPSHLRDGGSDLKVLLVGSSGGHLAQLLALGPWWSSHRRLWVTFDTPDATSLLANEKTVWAFHPTTRHVGNLLRNAILAWRTIRSFRPDIVVSTGAGVAYPFFVVGKLSGVATCYLEVYDRIDSRTLTGRLCRRWSDLFLVQWEEQAELYPGAQVIGRLL